MEEVGKVCAFTGHRPESLPWGKNEADPRCVELKRQLAEALKKLYSEGYRQFYCGMARGADFYFMEACLALRNTHPGVSIITAIPYPKQSSGWTLAERQRYRALADRRDREVVLSPWFDRGCYLRRNRYMVDHADKVLAIFNGDLTKGGTAATLSYAAGKGISSVVLWV